jgi:hypothetical protein
MPKRPSDSEQSLMTCLGIKTLEDMEEFPNRPMSPGYEERMGPMYPDDEPEAGLEEHFRNAEKHPDED